MRGLLADVNVEGHVRLLLDVCRGPAWADVWSYLALTAYRFADFGLEAAMPDAALWTFCRKNELVLITANRNREGEDSLQAAITTFGGPHDLPVITIGDTRRLFESREYLERAAERLLDILLDMDVRRGSGRLFIP